MLLAAYAQAAEPVAADASASTIGKATSIASRSLLVPGKDVLPALASNYRISQQTPKIDVALFDALPDKGKGTLWSTWGDGCIASNGKYYTSIGDHLGRDATSYVYEYDPAKRTMTRVVDVFKDLGLKPGAYGHGKIHSGIHEGPDAWLYFSTYWGKHREVEAAFGDSYQGSLVLRYHPAKRKLENLGAIVPRQGLPASHLDPKRQALYFYAVYEGDLCAFDLRTHKRTFLGGGKRIEGNRTLMHDAAGNVYFSGDGGQLLRFDPATKAIKATGAKLPVKQSAGGKAKRGATLRAAITRPAKDGTLFGMTAQGEMFAYQPKANTLRHLGPNLGGGTYTAAVAISPDDRYLYYAPGAHGSGNRLGAPVVQYEIATGEHKVLAFLRDTLRKQLNWNVGGTYNLQLDAKGQKVFVTFNGADYDPDAKKKLTFGKPGVVVLHVPKEER